MHDFKTTFSSSNALFIFTSQFATSIAALDLTAGRSNMSRISTCECFAKTTNGSKTTASCAFATSGWWSGENAYQNKLRPPRFACLRPNFWKSQHTESISKLRPIRAADVDTRHEIQGKWNLATWYHSGIYHPSAAGRTKHLQLLPQRAGCSESSKVG